MMFCPKCGTKLPDGSKFCGVCGEKLTDKYHAVNAVPVAVANGTAVIETNVKTNAAKKFSWKIIVFAIIAIIAMIAVAVGAISLFSGSSSKEDIFISLSEKDYVDIAFDLVTDTKNSETVEFDECYTNEYDHDMVQFSPDGKYVYYFSQYTNYGYCTLCRAEIDKIKKEPENYDEHIEIIAEEVQNYFALFDDDRVVYWTNENELYLYNNKGITKIADYADYWNFDDSNRLIYTVDSDDGSSTIYGVDIDEPENGKIIASEVYSFENYYTDDFENIIYTTEENGTEILYSVNFKGKKKEIYEGEKELLSGYNGETFIIGKNGEKNGLYEYEDGKLKTICDSILNFDYFFNGIVYNAADGKTMIFTDDGGTTYEISADVEETIGDINDYQYNEFFALKDTVYLLCDDDTLMMASVKNGSVGEFDEIAEDVEYISCWDNKIYFATDLYDENYEEYCDVFCVEKGKIKSLAENVALDYIKIYENGTVAGYREYEYPYGYELFLFDSKGNETLIDDSVEYYVLVDKDTLLYISENDLYIYEDEEKQKIKNDVYYVWSMNSLDVLELDWFY